MPGRVFLFLLTAISTLVVLTSPPILDQLIQHTPTSTPTSLRSTHTPTATSTTDPFASVPTATPINPNEIILIQPPPVPTFSDLSPTFPLTPQPITANIQTKTLPAPTSAGLSPQRHRLPRLEATSAKPVDKSVPVSGPGEFLAVPTTGQRRCFRLNCSPIPAISPGPGNPWKIGWLLLSIDIQFDPARWALPLYVEFNPTGQPNRLSILCWHLTFNRRSIYPVTTGKPSLKPSERCGIQGRKNWGKCDSIGYDRIVQKEFSLK